METLSFETLSLSSSQLLKSWDQQPFHYHYMIPLMLSFVVSKSLFLRFTRNISPRKFFKTMEAKHERDFWGSVFYVLCLIISVSVGETFTGSEGWRSDYVDCYRGWPHEQVHTWGVKFYYTFCLSFYLYSVMSLCFFEDKKKDFVAMVLHHLITIVTVFLSGTIEHYRIGVVIMLLFDACDIALELAKIFNKCKEDVGSIIAFSVFVVLWVRNRLYLFPLYIVPSIVNAEVLSEHEIPYHKLHVGIIITLFLLNIYWTVFIVKKMLGMLKGGLGSFNKGDPRDEKN